MDKVRETILFWEIVSRWQRLINIYTFGILQFNPVFWEIKWNKMQKKEVAKTHLPCVGVGILGVVEKWWITHILQQLCQQFCLWLYPGTMAGWRWLGVCFVKCKVSGLFIKKKGLGRGMCREKQGCGSPSIFCWSGSGSSSSSECGPRSSCFQIADLDTAVKFKKKETFKKCS